MAIALDLIVDNEANSLCEGIGLNQETYYSIKPDFCQECDSSRFRSYEILGILEVPMIWECKDCGARFSRFPIEQTEIMLSEVQGLWTNPTDWAKIPKAEYN